MTRLGLTQAQVLKEATKLTRRGDLARINRLRLHRLREGISDASEPVIRLLVAVMRSLTGIPVLAAELFNLEPPIPRLSYAVLMGHPDPFRSGTRRLSIFSLPHRSNPWRHSVDEEPLSATQLLELLYQRHAAFLHTTAKYRYRIPAEDVEELVHDIFLSYLQRMPRVDDHRAYLLGALRNAVSYYHRKHRHETPLLPEHEDTEDGTSRAREEQWTLRISLGATLSHMGEKCRETLRRYYLLEHSTEQIAQDQKTTPAYVFQLLHACRKRAREIYQRLTTPP